MSLLIVCPGRDPENWIETIRKKDSAIECYAYPEDHQKEDVEFALTWNHPRGIFKNYPNLKVIASMGAGVDHILSDPALPDDIQITRVVDDKMTEDMSNFVLTQALARLRKIQDYTKHQTEKKWDRTQYGRPQDTKIGIMGLGVLGDAVAEKLHKNNFQVYAWSRTEKDCQNITCFHGKEQMEEFLSHAEILVCLLPLTEDTRNILNADLFDMLPEGAYVINVARGEHLVEHDLLEMIDNGHLSGASLDVFREEPLPDEHPFWEHEKINITPHIASLTSPESVVPQIIENYDRMMDGKPLRHEVELEKGY
ncbi:MAG: glyoxylate/hydroxypyruvate reductase A [Bacteroidota bacterium]|uniref:D-3-phosphoglycerate dehydrogenase n=1 Tax=Christiangramia flava JLT2011 TaxID=1229726 RepID=A0A1L7I5E3_9FLAO|nr:glyoxylate/hydroxypyruvate reductase A [Christiangramia flava]APU68821.1 D-3-phosphoglycerate dehydrogenase [Christiangramia flava JLT2011]MEE2770775.1 glyoxylate/hydroxypyruvate reductase A [Bacteroidota bacterium]OSS39034.1 D-3-phosphoglycerate dehydrogenase [Christiangramia flava JLT2011]